MRLNRFAASAGRRVDAYGSAGLVVTHILRPTAGWHVAALYIEPAGVIGWHPAGADQLFLVVAGSGTFSGSEGEARDAVPGCAAFWSGGELHETRAGSDGLTGIVVEGEGLGAAIELPIWTE